MKAILIFLLGCICNWCQGQHTSKFALQAGTAFTVFEFGEQLSFSAGARFQKHELHLLTHWDAAFFKPLGVGGHYRFNFIKGKRFGANFSFMTGYYRYGMYIVLPDSFLDATQTYFQPCIGLSFTPLKNVIIKTDLSLGLTHHVSDPLLGVNYWFTSPLIQAGIFYEFPLSKRVSPNTPTNDSVPVRIQPKISLNFRQMLLYRDFYLPLYKLNTIDAEYPVAKWLRICGGVQFQMPDIRYRIFDSPLFFAGGRTFIKPEKRLSFFLEATLGYSIKDWGYGNSGYLQLQVGNFARLHLLEFMHLDVGFSHHKMMYMDRRGFEYDGWGNGTIGLGVDFGVPKKVILQ